MKKIIKAISIYSILYIIMYLVYRIYGIESLIINTISFIMTFELIKESD